LTSPNAGCHVVSWLIPTLLSYSTSPRQLFRKSLKERE
jgi:hypothetical protein